MIVGAMILRITSLSFGSESSERVQSVKTLRYSAEDL